MRVLREFESHLFRQCITSSNRRTPAWSEEYEYRIKPELKPDVVKYGLVMSNETATPFTNDYQKHDNIKLTFDGETGELKSAEVLK